MFGFLLDSGFAALRGLPRLLIYMAESFGSALDALEAEVPNSRRAVLAVLDSRALTKIVEYSKL